METALPTKHLSARVPWHDNKWNGTFCCNVQDNSFCRILPRIDGLKDITAEHDGQQITESYLPPCLAEKGTFLSPHEYIRDIKHAWSDYNDLYREYEPGKYHHKPFSFNAVPFLWMMKAKATISEKARAEDPNVFPHKSGKAAIYELNYKPELEQEIDVQLGFDDNGWVQHPHNQKVLLDAFFGCLKEQTSLVFFYAKHTPLSEQNERVIVGVAKVSKVGPLLNYKFPNGYKGYRSYPWDRCVEHTLHGRSGDGFLMPYHDLLAHASNNDIELHDYVAVSPNFEQFSYASELVEHDTAIDSLLNMAEALKKSEVVLNKSFKKELDWIDHEISVIWDMRGAFPGFGPVVSALKITEGNTIAWEIEKYILDKDGDLYQTNPWDIFDESMADPTKYLGAKGTKLFSPTAKVLWRANANGKKRAIANLLSRIQLNNEQAATLYQKFNQMVASADEILANPYLLFERTRYRYPGLMHFNQLDKGIVPPPKISDVFPLAEPSAMESYLDDRRVRAITVSVLEEAAAQGHSLLPFDETLMRLEAKVTEEQLPINEDILNVFAETDFFNQEVNTKSDGRQQFLKLTRLEELKTLICQKINKANIVERPIEISKDWLEVINDWPDFEELNATDPFYEAELAARKEKAACLDILTNYHVSVLIGPAGSGKTTLLKIFENQPEIQRQGVLKLAPTGKARVKLGIDGKTIGQFLVPDRYDPALGVYFLNKDVQKLSGAKNIIIDEASMLTEEQLSAILDALGPIERLILVGDYRQLPPIGTGKPFVDIAQLLRPDTFANLPIKTGPAYAELCQILRQISKDNETRIDVQLSRCFGDEPDKEGLSLFNQFSTEKVNNSYIRLEKWYNSTDFNQLLHRMIVEELDLDENDLVRDFNRTQGAVDGAKFQYFNQGEAEKMVEDWQIITPVNGYGYGTKEINNVIQQTYKRSFIDLAVRTGSKRYVAKPKGSDNMVYGDKVINLKNSKWESWQKVNPQEKKQQAYNYIANGEIGIITGRLRGRNHTERGEPNVEIAFSTQPGYSYVFYPNQFKEDSAKSNKFELAYAITVHKAQGSGFKVVFFVLPSKGSILSRELMYTALTRQEEKVIILHQGEFRDFIKLASTDASATARRFTDLFFLPEVRKVGQKYFDSRYINVSERGERMISKNEVIIANCLLKYEPQLTYSYEDKLKLESSGRTVTPDFTIQNNSNGKLFYWEHLGMMTMDSYREKWQKKLAGYLADGYILANNAKPGDNKILIVTEENPNGGIDSQYFDNLIRTVILAN